MGPWLRVGAAAVAGAVLMAMPSLALGQPQGEVVAADEVMPIRGSLELGVDLGGSGHAESDGVTAGIHPSVEFRLWRFLVGGSAGYDLYESVSGAPISSTTFAGRVGVALPAVRFVRAPHRRLTWVLSAELGRHNYSPSGGDRGFDLFGGDTTFDGPSKATTFFGARTGLVLDSLPYPGGAGFVWRGEVVARRDRHPVDLAFTRTTCGGLFNDGCNTTDGGDARVGGVEVALLFSVGLLFGQ